MKNEGAAMNSGKQIKIIKHTERSGSQAVDSDNGPTSVRRDRENRRREVVSVVKEWVSELRRRKSAEATNGFDSLFGNAA
jgi:hypothetical protein